MAQKTNSGKKVQSPAGRVRGSSDSPAVRTGTSAPVVLTHEQIARRARAIWEAKGRPAGQDEKIWHEAEAQLKAALGLR
jgi:hypothetical protein